MAAAAPALGKADGGDRSDRECQIVLRTVYRQPVGEAYETDCSSGACAWVWSGQVEVAEDAIAEGVSVGVLYHLASDPTWWEVTAQYAGAGAPGFRRHDFRLSEHLFGPDSAEGATGPIELVPFLLLPDGSRVFDHNRYAGDLENHVLTADYSFSAGDGGVCPPQAATAWFAENFEEGLSGLLRQGAYLVVSYDIDRLPACRGTHNGHPAWDVVAHVRFLPGGQLVSGTVREFETNYGTPTNVAHDKSFVVEVPADATSVELWFQNYTGAGSSCQTWDSNYGANYRFDVAPPADHPRCAGVETWSSIYGGQPTCLGYDLAAQHDATHCELWVDGFGHGYEGHYGIPYEWLVAYLQVPPQDGETLGVGLWTRSATDERFSFGAPAAPGVWKTGFTYHATMVQGGSGYHHDVEAFAFFVDVRRPAGEVVRLWQSRGGANYGWADAFGLPTTTEYISYGNVQWANEGAAVFESEWACR